jgi:hypothetical protein
MKKVGKCDNKVALEWYESNEQNDECMELDVLKQ